MIPAVVAVAFGGAVFVLVAPVSIPRGRRRRVVGRPAGAAVAVGRMRRRLRIPDDITDRQLLLSLVSTVVLGVALPPAAVVPPVVVGTARVRRRHRQQRISRARVDAVLPEVIDLVTLGVRAGLTVPETLALTAPWMPDPFGPVVHRTLRRVGAGDGLVDAVDAGFRELGDPVRPLTRVLVAAERDGAPLAPALERAGDEARRRRRVAAEEAARRVPVLLLFPLVTCVLPAFGLLTVVPVLVGTLEGLELPAPP